jgi:hypothetical protein
MRVRALKSTGPKPGWEGVAGAFSGFHSATGSVSSFATVSVLVDSYLNRADFEARWKGNAQTRFAGILTANEIRECEGFDPIEGGNVLQPPASTPMSGGATVSPPAKPAAGE